MAYKTWLKLGTYTYVRGDQTRPSLVVMDIDKDQVTWRWEDETKVRYMSVNMAEMSLKNGYSHKS
jgi:hypothetical protein